MTANGVFSSPLLVVLLALAKPLGAYMARVYEGRPVGLERVLGLAGALIYRLVGVRAGRGDGLEDVRDRDADLQPRWGCSPSICSSGSRASCR